MYDAAHAACACTPAAHEVVRLEGVAAGAPSAIDASQGGSHGGNGPHRAAYGVVVEYVGGVPLPMHMAVGSYGVEEAGYEVGRLQLQLQLRLHAARMRMGRDWKAEFLRLARRLRPLLPPEAGRKLVALAEAVPPLATCCSTATCT